MLASGVDLGALPQVFGRPPSTRVLAARSRFKVQGPLLVIIPPYRHVQRAANQQAIQGITATRLSSPRAGAAAIEAVPKDATASDNPVAGVPVPIDRRRRQEVRRRHVAAARVSVAPVLLVALAPALFAALRRRGDEKRRHGDEDEPATRRSLVP